MSWKQMRQVLLATLAQPISAAQYHQQCSPLPFFWHARYAVRSCFADVCVAGRWSGVRFSCVLHPSLPVTLIMGVAATAAIELVHCVSLPSRIVTSPVVQPQQLPRPCAVQPRYEYLCWDQPPCVLCLRRWVRCRHHRLQWSLQQAPIKTSWPLTVLSITANTALANSEDPEFAPQGNFRALTEQV